MSQSSKKLKIAILGTRGIPAEFGGFETFAQELAIRCADRGHDVTVFCDADQKYKMPEFNGVKLAHVCVVNITGIRSIWADLVGIVKTLRGYDVVYMLGYHSAFLYFIPRIFGVNFWVNMDGLEWRRSKWSGMVRFFLRFMEYCAVRFCTHIIADSQSIMDNLKARFRINKPITFLPYGAHVVDNPPNSDVMRKHGLAPFDYYLVVCRLEPENHIAEIICGFSKSKSTKKLVIVGDKSTKTSYVQSLLETNDDRVLFIGSIYDKADLVNLRYNAFCYCHGHSVGGTNPSLLEAMACGNLIIAHDNPFNREVTDNHGYYFCDEDSFCTSIDKIDATLEPGVKVDAYVERIRNTYNWDRITDDYIGHMRNAIVAKYS